MLKVKILKDKIEPWAIGKISSHVIEKLNWKFLSLPEKNIAIDGLIEIYDKRNRKTGEHLWVEVKSGESYIRPSINDYYFTLNFGETVNKIRYWKNIWRNVPGAMILIVVVKYEGDNQSPFFYWVDLKSEKSFVGKNLTQLIIPFHQTIENDFNLKVHSLVGYENPKAYINQLPSLNIKNGMFNYINLSKPLKLLARQQFKKWQNKPNIERTNPIFGEIIVNRVGWQNITRKKRLKLRIIQSWLLLPVAEEIIKKVSHYRKISQISKRRIDLNNNLITTKNYYYLRALVKFNHRRETIVYVVLREILIMESSTFNLISKKVWFYNVYEGERGLKKVGNPFLVDKTRTKT